MNDAKTKKCVLCHKWRNLSEYDLDKRTADLRSTKCCECKSKITLDVTAMMKKRAIKFNTTSLSHRIRKSCVSLDRYPVCILSEMLANQVCIMRHLNKEKD